MVGRKVLIVIPAGLAVPSGMEPAVIATSRDATTLALLNADTPPVAPFWVISGGVESHKVRCVGRGVVIDDRGVAALIVKVKAPLGQS